MFTGIISEVGVVEASRSRAGGRRIRITNAPLARELDVGASVAVEGVCLTVVALAEGWFEADVSAATAATTTLGDVKPRDGVNLELPATPASLLGGHFVQGHVDGVGTVTVLERRAGDYYLRVAAPEAAVPFVVERGSVAVSGISLTAVDVGDGSFGAVIIPHTFNNTTLPRRRVGDSVNVEADIIAKYVATFSASTKGKGLTAGRLAELGFTE